MLLKMCEGRMVPHAHTEDVHEYQYINLDKGYDVKSNLCSKCVAYDRSRGYVLDKCTE